MLGACPHFSANGRRPCWAPGRAVFEILIFFSDFFGTGARLGPDFGPLSLQTLIFIASGLVLEGSRPPESFKNLGFPLVFKGFLHSCFFAYVGSRASFFERLGRLWAPTWDPWPLLGRSWDGLGRLLGRSGAFLGRSWGVFWPPLRPLRRYSEHLMRFRCPPLSYLAPFW